jgi:hypothetical protein
MFHMHKKLSNVVHKFVYIPYSQHFFFDKMICPPDSCGTKKLIEQHDHYTGAPCAGTIKGHSNMRSLVTQHSATDAQVEGVLN